MGEQKTERETARDEGREVTKAEEFRLYPQVRGEVPAGFREGKRGLRCTLRSLLWPQRGRQTQGVKRRKNQSKKYRRHLSKWPPRFDFIREKQ